MWCRYSVRWEQRNGGPSLDSWRCSTFHSCFLSNLRLDVPQCAQMQKPSNCSRNNIHHHYLLISINLIVFYSLGLCNWKFLFLVEFLSFQPEYLIRNRGFANVTKSKIKIRTRKMKASERSTRCMRKYLWRESRYPHTLMWRWPHAPCSNFPNSISQIQFSPNDVIDNVITHHEPLLLNSSKHHVCEGEHRKVLVKEGNELDVKIVTETLRKWFWRILATDEKERKKKINKG